MKITLKEKKQSDIIFRMNRLQRRFIIYSNKYGIIIHRNINWTKSNPWIAYPAKKIIGKNIESLNPELIHNHIFIKSYASWENNLKPFLQELHKYYHILGDLV